MYAFRQFNPVGHWVYVFRVLAWAVTLAVLLPHRAAISPSARSAEVSPNPDRAVKRDSLRASCTRDILSDHHGRLPMIWRYSSSVNARQVSEVIPPFDVNSKHPPRPLAILPLNGDGVFLGTMEDQHRC